MTNKDASHKNLNINEEFYILGFNRIRQSEFAILVTFFAVILSILGDILNLLKCQSKQQ